VGDQKLLFPVFRLSPQATNEKQEKGVFAGNTSPPGLLAPHPGKGQ
jgi:hypothetical protein